MKKMYIAIGAIVVGLVILIISIFTMYVNYSNAGNRSEKQIEKLYNNSQSVLSNYTMTIVETTKVSTKYRKDLEDIIKATMSGRYGEDGIESVVTFLQEQNLQLDSKMYTNIQNTMIAGRKDFLNSQNLLMDACASYKTSLDNVVSGMFLRFAGYPKTNLQEKCTPITDEHTDASFKSKKQKAIDVTAE